MGRILAIDYGTKKTGLAATDPLQIIASAIGTVPTADLVPFLSDYLAKESVDVIVVGEPAYQGDSKRNIGQIINEFVVHLKKKFPQVQIDRMDESFTSLMAEDTFRQVKGKKSGKKDKETIDAISATIILQSYLDQRK